MQAHLLSQFRSVECSQPIREFGEHLIQNIDHNGRLTSSLEDMRLLHGQSISPDDAQVALSLVQRLKPAGVGARDLKECLLLQLKPDTPHRDLVIALITSHLDDLAQYRLSVIQHKTGYSIDLIKAAWEELKKLEPRPGRHFGSPAAP